MDQMLESGIGWIDFLSSHRDRVMSVIDLLNTEGVVDELGIGSVRNALSDKLFPGISTIQTRAKYFLIIPRIIQEYENKYRGSANIPLLTDFLKKWENQIIKKLVRKYIGSNEKGIFGVEMKGRELARKPSSIYWNGIRKHRIIQTNLSLSEYLSKHDKRQKTIRDILAETDDEQGDDKDAGYIDEFGVTLHGFHKDWTASICILIIKTLFLKSHPNK